MEMFRSTDWTSFRQSEWLLSAQVACFAVVIRATNSTSSGLAIELASVLEDGLQCWSPLEGLRDVTPDRAVSMALAPARTLAETLAKRQRAPTLALTDLRL
jgi:hypothetical protein